MNDIKRYLRTMSPVLALVAVGLMGWALVGSMQSQPEVRTKDVMKFKLHYTQRVLEGIATENFPLISTNAIQLGRLAQAADWMVRQTPEYQRLTREFQRHADALGHAATQKALDAATLAYFQLTVSCVNCHRYLRDARFAGMVAPVQPAMRD